MATLVAMSMAMMASCGSDDKSGNEPTPPVTPVTPSTDEAMTPDQQKTTLENVALEFLNETPSDDFTQIADLGDFIRNTYGEDYDWESVGDWAKDLWEDAREAVGTHTEEMHWGYQYVYTDYNALLMASNFTGHFIAKNGHWDRSDANDLQFIFPDETGTQCVLKLVTSGKVTQVHAVNIDDYQYWEGSTEYYDRTHCTIGVPENIEVTLTQGSKQIVKTTVKIGLSSLAGKEFDVSKSNIDVTCTTVLSNGYKFDVTQATYDANKQVKAAFTMTKNGKTLVTASASSSLSGIPSCNLSAFSEEEFDIDDYDTDNANAKNPFVKLDILGKVQLQGKMTEVRKFVDYLDSASDNDDNEATYKSYINQANGLMDVHLFFNNSSYKQATVRLEPFVSDSWNGKTYWTVEPVIVFYNGSSYSTFEAFFNDSDFKNTINTFKRLANRYAALVNEHINW